MTPFDPFVLLVKKVILKIQVKCSKSTSLEKKWFVSCKKSKRPNSFDHPVVCTKDLSLPCKNADYGWPLWGRCRNRPHIEFLLAES